MKETTEALFKRIINSEKTVENNKTVVKPENVLNWYDRLHKHDVKLTHKRSQSRVIMNFGQYLHT